MCPGCFFVLPLGFFTLRIECVVVADRARGNIILTPISDRYSFPFRGEKGAVSLFYSAYTFTSTATAAAVTVV